MNTYLTRNLDNRTRRLNYQPRRLDFKLRTIFSAFLLHPSTPIPEGTLLGPLSGIWEARLRDREGVAQIVDSWPAGRGAAGEPDLVEQVGEGQGDVAVP
jgi:hypothetical protein